ncbi:MAG: chloroperoxidase [Actinomycetota bacterium]|nr:chloroperoxidase [Actinomycetota bacterium]
MLQRLPPVLPTPHQPPHPGGQFRVDPILYWNDVALEANRRSHTNDAEEQTGPPLSARALAMVHLAMYDAYAGVCGNRSKLPPYLPDLPSAPAIASASAAVAGAAHATLSALFPSQKAAFDLKLAQAGLTGTPVEVSEGKGFGTTVAQALLRDRNGDPGVGDSGYTPSTARGGHRVDPSNPGQGYHAPFFGVMTKCFAVATRHALDKPPALDDNHYRKALRQVRGKGIAHELVGTVPDGIQKRTVDETIIGVYWAYDGAFNIGTPPRLYNQIVRQVAMAQGNTVAENARLFALVNAAMGDAAILFWEQKYAYELWRPVLGVREHDPSMGTSGVPGNDVADGTDVGWLPLGAPNSNRKQPNFTPSSPAYPSGHATFGAAALQMTRLFYNVTAAGPDTLFDGLSFVSDEYNGQTTDNRGTVRPRHSRSFPEGLWGMIKENSLSGVFLGVHWVFDAFAPGAGGSMDLSKNVGGVPLGFSIAEDIYNGGRAEGLTKSKV